MKFTLSIVALLGLATAAPTSEDIEKRATVQGFDISHYQATFNYQAAYNAGARFGIIKATEGTTYKDPKFSTHYTGCTKAGIIRGGYHFAQPASSSGAAQAKYFHSNGGGWSNDGKTLPGMLDMEYGPNGNTCYGLSTSAMVSWIKDFTSTYKSLSGRDAMIYSTADWWKTCTGNSNAFSSTSPLVLARYSTAGPGTIPGGWGFQTIWQNSDSYQYGGDSDIFNGSLDRLKALASG